MINLLRKILAASSSKVVTFLIGLFTFSLTARWLGPEGRGLVASVTTWLSMFSVIGNMSLGQVAVHHAAHESDQSWFSSTFGSLLFFTLIFSVLGWVIVFLLYIIPGSIVFYQLPSIYMFIIFLSLPFAIWEQYSAYLLMAIDQFRFYNRALVIGKIASAVLLFIGWMIGGGIIAALISLDIGQVIQSSGGARYLLKKSNFQIRPDFRVMQRLIVGGLKLNVGTVGAFFASTSGILIINHYLNPTEAGFYQLALQLINFMAVIPVSVSQVLYSEMVAAGSEKSWSVFRKPLLFTSIFLVFMGVSAWIFVPIVVTILAGESFKPSIYLFRWGLISFGELGFNMLLGNIWVIKGWFLQLSILNLFSGVLSVGLTFILVPVLGAMGGIWGMTLGYLIIFLANIIVLIKLIKSQSKNTNAGAIVEMS